MNNSKFKLQGEDWLTLLFLARPLLVTTFFIALSTLAGLLIAHWMHQGEGPVRPVDCIVYGYVIFRGRRCLIAFTRRRLSITNLKK